MNTLNPMQGSEIVLRRFLQTIFLFDFEINPTLLIFLTVVTLILLVVFIVICYKRETRTIQPSSAIFLCLLRLSLLVIITWVFFLPARQYWITATSHSNVVFLIDSSISMFKKSHVDPKSLISPNFATQSSEILERSRIDDVISLFTYNRFPHPSLSNTSIPFLHRMALHNPIRVYRFARMLDEEPRTFAQRNRKWELSDWNLWLSEPTSTWDARRWSNWLSGDLKQWVLDSLSSGAADLLRNESAFLLDTPGDENWVSNILPGDLTKYDPSKILPASLLTGTDPHLAGDRATLSKLFPRVNSDNKRPVSPIETRLETLIRFREGTDVISSTSTVLLREARSSPRAIFVFSDGRSNCASESSIPELRDRAKSEGVPIVTVLVGQDFEKIEFRFTDIQAPESSLPNEPFKVYIDAESFGLPDTPFPIQIHLIPPDSSEPLISLPTELRFTRPHITADEDSPPHASVEVSIDPDLIAKQLPEPLKNKYLSIQEGSTRYSFVTGNWKLVAKAKREAFPPKANIKTDIISFEKSIRLQQRPPRVLLFSSAAGREFQFLRVLLERDKIDHSIVLQNDAGTTGKIALTNDPRRALKDFPRYFRSEGPTKPVSSIKDDKQPTDHIDIRTEERLYNLNEYDVIVAIDPDWSKLSPEQIRILRDWVEKGGGLVYLAGIVNTYQLGAVQQDQTGERLQPLLDILPVQPVDIRLGAIRLPSATADPHRLQFGLAAEEFPFLKIDDSKSSFLDAWNDFFGPTLDKELLIPTRGFYSCYPLQDIKKKDGDQVFTNPKVKPGATILAEFIQFTPDKKSDNLPYMIFQKFGSGRTLFVAAADFWRLQQHNRQYHTRLWTKLIRYLKVGRDSLIKARGRFYVNSVFPAGTVIRIRAQFLNREYKPVESSAKPQIRLEVIDLHDHEFKNDLDRERAIKDVNASLLAKFSLPSEAMLPDGSDQSSKWTGVFTKQIRSYENRLTHTISDLPPGRYRLTALASDDDDPIETEFRIVKRDPELSDLRLDPISMAKIATPIDDFISQLADQKLGNDLRTAIANDGQSTTLSFHISNHRALELMADAITSDYREIITRTRLEDIWDDGPMIPGIRILGFDLPSSKLPWVLIIAVALLTVEWSTRKLLRLA